MWRNQKVLEHLGFITDDLRRAGGTLGSIHWNRDVSQTQDASEVVIAGTLASVVCGSFPGLSLLVLRNPARSLGILYVRSLCFMLTAAVSSLLDQSLLLKVLYK